MSDSKLAKEIKNALLGPGQHFDKVGGHEHDPTPTPFTDYVDPLFITDIETDPDGPPAEEQIGIKVRGEMARRERCRRDIIAFAERFAPMVTGEPYIAGWVHRDIGSRLMKFMRQVEQKERPRLMLLMPPRHGKSLLVSILFFAWVLGHHPEWKMFNVGYNEDLPVEFSKAVRDILSSKAYQQIFAKTRIAQGDRSASDWATSGRGGMRAAGMAGGITGHGANIMGIDDPLKGAEESASATARDKLWEGFMANVRTRIQPGGGVLLIQTWWNDDDMAGRLMKMNHLQDELSEFRDKYEIISYPALTEANEYEYYDNQTTNIIRMIYEEDEEPFTPEELDDMDYYLIRGPKTALHEERYGYRELMAIKADMTDRHWSALYQQNPIPESGIFFMKDYQYLIPQLPDPQGGQVATGWDFAIGERKRNNFTCGTTVQQIHNGIMYVRNANKFKSGSSAYIIDRMVLEAKVYLDLPNPPHYVIGVEKGHIWDTLKDSVKTAFKEANISMSIIEEYTASTEKEARAIQLQDKWDRGYFRLLEKSAYIRDFLAEFMKFPNAKDADQVDSSVWAVKRLLDLGPPRLQVEDTPRQKDRYTDARYSGWRERMTAKLGKRFSHMGS